MAGCRMAAAALFVALGSTHGAPRRNKGFPGASAWLSALPIERIDRPRANASDTPAAAGVRVLAIVERERGARRAFAARAFAASAHVESVEFVDPVWLSEPSERARVLGNRSFAHLHCAAWREYAIKRVGVWAAWMRALAQAAAAARPSVLVEADVHFVAGAFDAHIARIDALARACAVDLVFLGSCFEWLWAVERCWRVHDGGGGAAGAALHLFRARKPLCAHGLLVSPAGASRLARVTGRYLELYHGTLRSPAFAQPAPSNCSAAYRAEVGAGQPVGDPAYAPSWLRVYTGKDNLVMDAVYTERLLALHAWPQLTLQAVGTRLSEHYYNYTARPRRCERGLAKRPKPGGAQPGRCPLGGMLSKWAVRRARRARQRGGQAEPADTPAPGAWTAPPPLEGAELEAALQAARAAPLAPRMAAADLRTFVLLVRQWLDHPGALFAEWGSGGSSYLVLSSTPASVYSVDSAGADLARVSAALPLPLLRRYHPIQPRAGGAAARPGRAAEAAPDPAALARAYVRALGARLREADVVLIDGRLRVRCALETFSHARRGALVAVRDFVGRPQYSLVYSLFTRLVPATDARGRVGLRALREGETAPSDGGTLAVFVHLSAQPTAQSQPSAADLRPAGLDAAELNDTLALTRETALSPLNEALFLHGGDDDARRSRRRRRTRRLRGQRRLVPRRRE